MSDMPSLLVSSFPNLSLAPSPRRPLASSIAIFLGLCTLHATAADPWKEMDYGPFLSATLSAPYPKPANFACKGIIIPLKAARSVNVAFDTDLLRYSAGWTGGFVDWKNVAFDGSHETSLSLVGEQIFGNGVHAGWADAYGKFDDPRSIPYGPLPREHYQWKGLYLHEGKVVLSYRIGQCDILEQPGLSESDGHPIFSRTLQIGPSSHDLILQVSESQGHEAKLISKQLAQDAKISIGFFGDPDCAWDVRDSSFRLQIPAKSEPRTIRVLISSSMEPIAKTVQTFQAIAKDWQTLISGGPPRWEKKLTTEGRIGKSDGPYAVDEISAPQDNPWRSWLRFTGFDFFKDGRRAAICTWNGDVWLVDGIDEKLSKLIWQRIATGLFQPLGLKIVDEQIYVLGRDQITRLHDLNNDGETDFYENFNNDAQVTEHFHEFAMDLQVGPDGDFYYTKAARHEKEAIVPQHGTLIHLSKDGQKTEIVCGGFRAPNGLGISPRGEFVSSDQEGHWLPMNRINWLRPGKFYGNMWAHHPGPRPTSYEPPLCWVPNWFDRSPAAQVWVTSDRWGPLKDGLISLSYGTGRISSIMYEEVDGVIQGGMVALPVVFDTGVIRGRFHPHDGQLYTCGLFGSWGSDKTAQAQFARVRYINKPLYLPTELHATAYGMVITFTDPLDAGTAADPHNYLIERWNYQWTARYGSEDFRLSDGQKGRDRVSVTGVKLSHDGRSVFLQIPDMRTCMQMQIKYNLRAKDGSSMSQVIVNSVHTLRQPELPDIEFEGGLTPPPPPPKEEIRADDLAPGLALRFARALRSRDAESEQPLDMRPSRMLALSVPEVTPPSPFVNAGAFSATFEGYIQTELAAAYTFEAEGRGRFALYINEKEAIAPSNLPATTQVIDLPAGMSRIRARFITDNRARNGDARLRVYWKSKDVAREPIPPTVLFHDRQRSGIDAFDRLHLGRELLTTRHCLKCHTPDDAESLKKTGMLELSMEAPLLEGIGSRLNADWIAHWLNNPRAIRADAHMPSMFHDSERAQQITDVAVYLATLADDKNSEPLDNPPGDPTKGAAAYEAFGCIACHITPRDKEPDKHNRIALSHVRAKFKPRALQQYLIEPERHHTWTRMPNFHLSRDQAADLAAYLLSIADRSPTKLESPQPGSADRGKTLVSEMGCLNCHTLPLENQYKAPPLSQFEHSDMARACLSRNPAAERSPDFALNDAERAALQSLARAGFASLARRDLIDFTRHQIKALRCTACHSMDSQGDTWSKLTAQEEPPEDEQDDEEEEVSPTKRLANLLGIERINDTQARPSLTWPGEKFHVDWMAKFIAGTIDPKPRPGLLARMPSFPAYAEALAHGLARQHGVDLKPETEPPINRDMLPIAEELVGVGKGFGCTTCHAVGAQPPVAGSTLQAINFSIIHRRLRKEYYWHWIFDPQRIEPGSMMPRFVEEDWRSPFTTHYDGDARKQFEAVWHYIRSVEDSPAAVTRPE